jgi:hypothetical protein
MFPPLCETEWFILFAMLREESWRDLHDYGDGDELPQWAVWRRLAVKEAVLDIATNEH